jgi:hypothetical protein
LQSKLIISWIVGGRDSDFAMGLMDDLRSRFANRIQLITDGHRAYLKAVEGAGTSGEPGLTIGIIVGALSPSA